MTSLTYITVVFLYASAHAFASSDSSALDPTSDGADSSGHWPSHDCNGRGKAYCNKPAVMETRCPRACRVCDESPETSALSETSKEGVYDHVYILMDRLLCLSTCNSGGRASCADWDRHKGVRFCRSIRCKRTTVEGCHSSSDFFEPSCVDCERIFPLACGPRRRGSDSSDSDSSDSTDSSQSGSSYRGKGSWKWGPKALVPKTPAPTRDPVFVEAETFYGIESWESTGGVVFRVVQSNL